MIAIDRFKADEFTDQLACAPLIDDLELVQLIGAWPQVKIEQRTCARAGDTWDDLWRHFVVDVDQIAELLNVSTAKAGALLERAIQLRYVYPDGDRNQTALVVAQGVMAAELQARAGGQRRDRKEGRE